MEEDVFTVKETVDSHFRVDADAAEKRLATNIRAAAGKNASGGLGTEFHVSVDRNGTPPDGWPYRCGIKYAHDSLQEDKNGLSEKYFRTEFDTLRMLGGISYNACKVPRVYAYGTLRMHDVSGEYPAFVMEHFTSCKSLGEYVESAREEGHVIGPQRCARSGIALLGLLERVWDKSVVHGDLSYKNVLVVMGEDSDPLETLRVIDFGQAKKTFGVVTINRNCTFPFAAPEVDKYENSGVRHADFRDLRMRNEPTVDLWSLGALLYYMRMGCLAFNENDPVDKQPGAKRKGIVLPEGCVEPGDESLREAIRICTRWNPEERRLEDIKAALVAAVGASGTARQPEDSDIPESTPVPEGLVSPERDDAQIQARIDALLAEYGDRIDEPLYSQPHSKK